MKLFYFKSIALASLFVSSTIALKASDDKNAKTQNSDANSSTISTSQSNNTTKSAADTSWKPVRRLWGLAFGDFYYDQHADGGGRGAETNYSGVPTYRNAFQFRRIYLGYDYDINQKFSVEALLASEPTANTAVAGSTSIPNGDNLVDGKESLYIKYLNLRWKNVFNGSDLQFGELATPLTYINDQVWANRFIERSVADFHKSNTYDVGASLKGYFDPQTKNYGYNLMIGNNSQATLGSAASANTGFFKEFYGEVYGWFLDKHLVVDLYADYVQTASSTGILGQQSHNMFKGTIGYVTPKFAVGLEGYTNKIANGLTATQGGVATPADATVEAISIYARGAIYKNKLSYFARYDNYNPDSDFDAGNTYTVNTNLSSYNPFQKETFYLAGIDYTPAPNIHFAPNVWLDNFSDQRSSTTTGYLTDDHTLIYRLTFSFTFGK